MSNVPVKIGLINDSMNMLDHFIALDAGHYAEQGLDVEFAVQTSQDSFAVLDSGEVLLTSSTPWIIEAILRFQTPYRFALINRKNPPHSIIARPEIKTVADLRGKTVWVSGRSSTNYYMTIDWLRANGLEPDVDVNVVGVEAAIGDFFIETPSPWASAGSRLSADAAMMVPPESEWFVQVNKHNELVELCAAYPNRMVHGLAGTAETLRKQPELVGKVVRAHQQASRTIQQDRATTVRLMSRRWGITEATAARIWEKVRGNFIAETDPSWLTLELEYFQKHLQERFPAENIAIPDPATLIDASFAAQPAAR